MKTFNYIEEFTRVTEIHEGTAIILYERKGYEDTWFEFEDHYIKKVLKKYIQKESKLDGNSSKMHTISETPDDGTRVIVSEELFEQYSTDLISAAMLSPLSTDPDVQAFIKYLCVNYDVFDESIERVSFVQYYSYIVRGLADDDALLINKDSESVDDWTLMKPKNVEINGGLMSPPTISINGQSKFAYDDGVVDVMSEFDVPYAQDFDFKNLEVDFACQEDIERVIENRKMHMASYTSGMYRAIKGNIHQPSMFGSRTMYADNERSMVDAKSFAMLDYSEYRRLISSRGIQHDTNPTVTPKSVMTDNDYALLDNTVVVYGLRNKEWWTSTFNCVKPITFRDDAFERLILADNKKRLLSAIVHEHKVENMDFIDDKSGNGIILLHGVAGTGKTLTAESVAESTRKPLYKVTLGELGVDLDSLETNLSHVLSLCEHWDAILLIDEADVFLEQRTSNDIERNAMVAVFLRLLEYYNGIMFLTTNRAMQFDSAFTSRITLAIEYRRPESYRMWTSLLELSRIELPESDIKYLCDHDLNGRQIKNCINSAKSLAKYEKASKVDITHIEPFITETNTFNGFMNGYKKQIL